MKKVSYFLAVVFLATSVQADPVFHPPVVSGSISGFGNATASAGGSPGVVTSTETLSFASGQLSTGRAGVTNYNVSVGFDSVGHALTRTHGMSSSWATTHGSGGFNVVLPMTHTTQHHNHHNH